MTISIAKKKKNAGSSQEENGAAWEKNNHWFALARRGLAATHQSPADAVMQKREKNQTSRE